MPLLRAGPPQLGRQLAQCCRGGLQCFNDLVRRSQRDEQPHGAIVALSWTKYSAGWKRRVARRNRQMHVGHNVVLRPWAPMMMVLRSHDRSR
jgi:hypothetical protein